MVLEKVVSQIELNQRLRKSLLLSSRQIGWNGILAEQYQIPSTLPEAEIPALSDHWLNLPLGHPVHLTQKRDDRLHESIVQQGDTIFVPAGQPSYWCRQGDDSCPALHIYLKPKSLEQVAEAAEIDVSRLTFISCFAKPDLHLHYIAMLILDELRSGGMMGQLYIESLTQVLSIHLLRHYSTLTQPLTPVNRSLTPVQLQQAIDYVMTHLDQDLSMAQIAAVVNISPTHFASLFKRATGISLHQYVIQQRVEQAELLLTKTNLAIADIAVQVGFSSQSHLTQQFKRLTGLTPKQVR